jgi:hypothetical protein
MVTHREISPNGREKISVSPPERLQDVQRLAEENESLRRRIIELELEKKLGIDSTPRDVDGNSEKATADFGLLCAEDEIALRMFQAQDQPLLPPVQSGMPEIFNL